jgi:hypothetical protein
MRATQQRFKSRNWETITRQKLFELVVGCLTEGVCRKNLNSLEWKRLDQPKAHTPIPIANKRANNGVGKVETGALEGTGKSKGRFKL